MKKMKKKRGGRELDLRKLIKYEESLGVNVHQKNYFDDLYRKTTASYRAKVDATDGGYGGLGRQSATTVTTATQTNGDKENLENRLRRKGQQKEKKAWDDGSGGGCVNFGGRRGILKDTTGQQQQRQSSRTTSETTVNTKSIGKKRTESTSTQKTTSEGTMTRPSRSTAKSSSVMWIRPRSKTPRTKTMDPVALYQYYQNEWEKFKTNLPGETNRSELRWQIRHKLLGDQ